MNFIFAFVEITILLGKQVNNVNKLTLKYQNAYEILNNFITEYNQNFLRLKEYFKKRYCFNMSIRPFFQRIFVEWMTTA